MEMERINFLCADHEYHMEKILKNIWGELTLEVICYCNQSLFRNLLMCRVSQLALRKSLKISVQRINYGK